MKLKRQVFKCQIENFCAFHAFPSAPRREKLNIERILGFEKICVTFLTLNDQFMKLLESSKGS